MAYKVGTILNIKGIEGRVIGYITYANPNDEYKEWTEYRLKTSKGECWLSCDDEYNEYSVSWPANDVKGNIGPEWHKVDEGVQIVRASDGDVDVDYGERAEFVEYEDNLEDNTLSVEMWSDGTEYSKGYYVEKTDIFIMGYKKPAISKGMKDAIGSLTYFIIILIVFFGMGITTYLRNLPNKSIEKYLKKSSSYTYETSITGKEKQKADVYKYNIAESTDNVAEDLIQGIEGYTESVTQKNDESDAEIAIVTEKEYCLVYHAEDDENYVYVQVSSRKYNYTSNNAPYRCSDSDIKWYRSHYYSSSYSSDSMTYKNTPSAYTMYDGDTVHNIGNGYFDSYSSSIRQQSINSRNSSSGGISSGK